MYGEGGDQKLFFLKPQCQVAVLIAVAVTVTVAVAVGNHDRKAGYVPQSDLTKNEFFIIFSTLLEIKISRLEERYQSPNSDVFLSIWRSCSDE